MARSPSRCRWSRSWPPSSRSSPNHPQAQRGSSQMADSKFAAPEMAAIEVKGLTREAFLIRGTLAAVAVGGVGAVGPFLSDAFAQSAAGDLAILNYALTLEYLESEFYNVKGKTVGLTGAAKSLAAVIGMHEAAHVAGLAAAIKAAGGTPAKKPTFKFPVTNQKQFLALPRGRDNP